MSHKAVVGLPLLTHDTLVHSSNYQRVLLTHSFIHSLIPSFTENTYLMQLTKHLGSSPYFLTELTLYKHYNLKKKSHNKYLKFRDFSAHCD